MRISLAATVLLTATTLAPAGESVRRHAGHGPALSATAPRILPEQPHLGYRDPSSLMHQFLENTAPPPTVADPQADRPERALSLDEAISIALQNSEVIRVLSGTLAGTSGRTVYDAAISNTTIDQQQAAFDPQLVINNTWTQTEPPGASFNPASASDALFAGLQNESHNATIDLSQRTLSGGTARFRFSNIASRLSPGVFPSNPQNRFFTEVSYVQPLLRGAGRGVNEAPIVIAKIDAERSFFQLRSAVQELVRGVIDAYWQVVSARTDVWARDIQYQQSQASLERAEARKTAGFADITEVAQARSAVAQFRVALLNSEANLIQREAALRNILGLSPIAADVFVPTTPPMKDRVEFNWNQTLALAEDRRPDLIELKLILEADAQRLLQSRNQARPTFDAIATYRWNGLTGQTPAGSTRSTESGQFTDWTLGLNFSVPLLLRAERAQVRSAEMLIARDRANLHQGLHNAQHVLALTVRNLEQAYLQYEALTEAREAARLNLERQFAAYRVGSDVLFLNVLQAISDWGNAVTQQAAALLQYNTGLANLERETGTILETHGVFFVEDRRCSAGPCWLKKRRGRPYATAHHPTPPDPHYVDGDKPAEEAFDLEDYPQRGDEPRRTRDADDEDADSRDSEEPNGTPVDLSDVVLSEDELPDHKASESALSIDEPADLPKDGTQEDDNQDSGTNILRLNFPVPPREQVRPRRREPHFILPLPPARHSAPLDFFLNEPEFLPAPAQSGWRPVIHDQSK